MAFNKNYITMSMIKEFKEFAMRGSVVDLAVGIVIGGAFGKIVASFVNDVLMPPIGLLLGGVSFADLQYTLQAASTNAAGEEVGAVAIKYGMFIQSVVDFVIIAFAIFMVVKAMNSMKKKEEAAPAAPPAPTKDQELLTEIRDALVKK
jgi:large conductance mechanosensitive channel